jgi:hypothetical protein
MPTSTWDSLASTTPGTAVQEVTFTSISQLYTDLYIVVNAATDATTVHDITWRANGDTGSNYAFCRVLAQDSGAFTDGNGAANQVNCNQAGTDPNATWLQIFNYASTSVYKASIMKTATIYGTSVTMSVGSGTWKSTSAITSVTLRNEQGTFDSGSSFTLYGILKA